MCLLCWSLLFDNKLISNCEWVTGTRTGRGPSVNSLSRTAFRTLPQISLGRTVFINKSYKQSEGNQLKNQEKGRSSVQHSTSFLIFFFTICLYTRLLCKICHRTYFIEKTCFFFFIFLVQRKFWVNLWHAKYIKDMISRKEYWFFWDIFHAFSISLMFFS